MSLGLDWRASLRVGVWCGLGLVLVACGGGGGSDSPPDPGVDGSPYVPLAVGDRWFTQSAGIRSETRVQETRSTAFGTGHVLLTELSDGSIEERVLVKSADGVRTVPSATDDAIARAIGPVQILRFPLRVGSTHTAADASANNLFDFDGDGRFDAASVRIDVTVVGFETLTTTAGTFSDALRVRTVITQSTTLSSNGQRVTVITNGEEWYGRGIGVLRSVFTFDVGAPGASTVEEVLQGWRIGSNSSDSVAPTASSRTPAPGSVTRTATIGIGFSEAMDRRSVGATGLRVQLADGSVLVGRTEWADDRSLRFVPAAGTLPSGVYSVSLAQVPEDLLGNRLAGDASFAFTLDSRGPTLVSTSPAADAIDVALDGPITLTFDEPVAPASVVGVSLRQDGTVQPARAEASGNRVTLTPLAPLQRGLAYEVAINPLLTDTLGNAAALATLRFTTDPGRFALPVSMGSGLVRGLGLGDIDGDGVPDLLRSAEIPGSSAVGVFAWRRAADGSRIGSGWQTLSTAFSSFSGLSLQPTNLGVGDVDRNGRPDIVYVTSMGLGWLSQGSDGSWAASNLLPTFVNGMQLLPARGSDRPVIAYYGNTLVAPGLRLLRSVGGFGVAGELLSAGPNLQGSLLSGDFNGDGLVDLVTVVRDFPEGSPGSTGFRLLQALQRADGSFELVEQAVPASVLLAEAADIDGDGRLDLIAYVDGDSRPSVLRQRAGGGFDAPRLVPLLNPPRNVEVADVDGDGRRDFVYFYDVGGLRRLAWARQAADGSFVDTPLLEFARPPDLADAVSLLVVDVTGDGRVDILAGNSLFVQRPSAAAASAAESARSRVFGGRLLLPGRR